MSDDRSAMTGGGGRLRELTEEAVTEALTYLLHAMRDPERHHNEVRVDIAKFLVGALARPADPRHPATDLLDLGP